MVQIFPAAVSAKRAISRSAYLLFTFGLALLLCGVIGGAATLASGSRSQALLIAALVAAWLGLSGLVFGIVRLARLRQPIQVEVGPHRLIWREGAHVAALEYDEVERVELVKGHKRLRDGLVIFFPVVRFIENDGEMMEFEVSFEDRGVVHHSRFDARAIMQAVLPYLRQSVVIAPAVDEFVQSGAVDIDNLPER